MKRSWPVAVVLAALLSLALAGPASAMDPPSCDELAGLTTQSATGEALGSGDTYFIHQGEPIAVSMIADRRSVDPAPGYPIVSWGDGTTSPAQFINGCHAYLLGQPNLLSFFAWGTHTYTREGTFSVEFSGYVGPPTKLTVTDNPTFPEDANPGAPYVALGDSYASGEGAWPFTPYSAANGCRRSKNAYSQRISRSPGGPALDFRACSGAQIPDITKHSVTHRGEPAQISAVTPATRVVTISIGGNDVFFAPLLQRCQRVTNCHTQPADPDKNVTVATEELNRIRALHQRLVDTYTAIRTASDQKAAVVVIGYPIFVPDPTRSGFVVCPELTGFQSGELTFIRNATIELNKTVAGAAKAAGVQYVDVQNAFNGKESCPPGQNAAAAHGIAVPLHSSFHPNGYGHELLAGIIRPYVINPRPNPAPAAVTPPATSAPVSVMNLVDGSMDGGWFSSLNAGDQMHQVLPGFKPGSPVTVTMHSDPVVLGTFTALGNGAVDAAYTVPADAPPGLHTIEATGRDADGRYVTTETQIAVGHVSVPPLTGAKAVPGPDGTIAVSWTAPPVTGGMMPQSVAVWADDPTFSAPSMQIGASADHTSGLLTGLKPGVAYDLKTAVVLPDGDMSPTTDLGIFTAKPGAPLASASAFVTRQYKDFLARTPTSKELSTGTSGITSGKKRSSDLSISLAHNATWVAKVEPVTRLHLAYNAAVPTTAELKALQARISSGTSLAAVSNSLATSASFVTTYGSLSNADFVQAAFLNVLGRRPTSAEDTDWGSRLGSGITRGGLMLALSQLPEYDTLTRATVDCVSLSYGMLHQVDVTLVQAWVSQIAAGLAEVPSQANPMNDYVTAILNRPAYPTAT